MAIRTFSGETWICGWFDQNGRLTDVQQYSAEEGARQTADKFKQRHQTFVGKIEDVTEWEDVPNNTPIVSVLYTEYEPETYSGVVVHEEEGVDRVFNTGDFEADYAKACSMYPNLYKSSMIDHFRHDLKEYQDHQEKQKEYCMPSGLSRFLDNGEKQSAQNPTM